MANSIDRAETVLGTARRRIDAVLEEWSSSAEPAIRYSLTSPGKRLRGTLTIEVYGAVGGTRAEIAQLAAAVEVIHAYSLVHDDLPCMDNDALRRGRPTTHKAFDVPAATRAGFAMVPLAARLVAHAIRALSLGAASSRDIALELCRAAGAGGMIGGQYLDLEAEGRRLSLSELEELHRAKTGRLIAAACVAGGMAAGATPAVVRAVRQYGDHLGLAYQIADDVLDTTGQTEIIGKTAGKDRAQAKATFVSAVGAAGARAEAARRATRAVDALRGGGLSSETLEHLAAFVIHRRS